MNLCFYFFVSYVLTIVSKSIFFFTFVLMTAWFVESSSKAIEVFYLKFNRSLEASITISTGTNSISK
jgi:hypothetical protein